MKSRQFEELAKKLQAASKRNTSGSGQRPTKVTGERSDAKVEGAAAAKKVVAAFRKALAHTD